MNKGNLIISLLIIPFFLQAQEISYSIKAELDSKEKIIKVNQKMKFLNNSKMEISEIFLEDWNNAYVDNNTALAKRMSDEYSRVFSFAQKKQRGYDCYLYFHRNMGEEGAGISFKFLTMLTRRTSEVAYSRCWSTGMPEYKRPTPIPA